MLRISRLVCMIQAFASASSTKSGVTRRRPLGLTISTLMGRSFCVVNRPVNRINHGEQFRPLGVNLYRPLRVPPLSLVAIPIQIAVEIRPAKENPTGPQMDRPVS